MKPFTTNLEDVLVAQNSKKVKSEEEALKFYQQILNTASSNDEQFFRNLGFDNIIDEAKRKTKELEEIGDERIFSLKAIEKVCLKYNLKFCQFKNYNRPIPGEILGKIKEFKEKKGYTLYKSDFYIVAPKNHFKKVLKPVSFANDPLLFYKTDNGNYELIAKWGKDMTIVRRLNPFTHLSSVLFMAAMLLIFLYNILADVTTMTSFGQIFLIIVTIVISFFSLVSVDVLCEKCDIGEWDFRKKDFE